MRENPESSEHQTQVSSQHARAYQKILGEVFGVPFSLFDANTGVKVADGSTCELEPSAVLQLAAVGQALVVPWERDSFRISLVLHGAGTPLLIGLGVVPALAQTVDARALEQTRLQTWARDFCERLRLRDQLSARAKVEEELRRQVTGAWKVNLALGECMQRLRFNRHEVRDRQRILETALELLEAEALLWVSNQWGTAPLIAGKVSITPEVVQRLAYQLSQNPEARGPDPFLCSNPQGEHWRGNLPPIDSLMAFNVTGQTFSGWLIALNKYGKASSRSAEQAPRHVSFRRSDAALLSPFVSMLEMHARAASKFEELRSLLVGLARSLTAAIDAKDAYTAGHSERVARLAVEIGRELGLPEEQVSDAYLAGLLHDVGKIGIQEAVLHKPTRLSAEEFDHMKQHVTIGYQILQDLQPIRQLLPGVLYHHERIDGKGYPEGLVGDKIPFLARLLAVADGFDAMNSNRPYRPAMSHNQVCEELKKGAGTHWDSQIVAAALRCWQRLVAISQRGLGESLRHAVDTALRTGESSLLQPAEHSPSLQRGGLGVIPQG